MNASLLHARKRALVSFVAAALAAAALTACGNKAEPTKDSPPPSKPASTGGGQLAASPGVTNAPAAVTNAPMAITNAPAAAAPGPNGRSAVPTLDEWSAAKEVGVKGSTKLNCETKMVREWLRVSCRGKNDTGGEPRNVTITKGGGRGDTFTLASNKVASLVCPFVDGVDLQAQFEWTDKKQLLVVSWPHGAPMPPLKGEFR